jgi:heme/copper-type cytochrome/quinol oxidase subunit 3
MNIALTIDSVQQEALPSASEAGPAPKRIVVAYGFWIFLLSDIVMFAALFASYRYSLTRRQEVRPAPSCSIRPRSRSKPPACSSRAIPAG